VFDARAACLDFLEILNYLNNVSLHDSFEEGDFLAKKKGEKYKCEECGLVVLVENPCTCETCDIVCCSTPMKPVKEEKAAAKTKPKPKAKATKKK
jgi:hypothetical protein